MVGNPAHIIAYLTRVFQFHAVNDGLFVNHVHAWYDMHVVCTLRLPCSIRSFEDVLVKIHDQVDSARDLNVKVAIRQEQQLSVVWHNLHVYGSCSKHRQWWKYHWCMWVALDNPSYSNVCHSNRHKCGDEPCVAKPILDVTGHYDLSVSGEPDHLVGGLRLRLHIEGNMCMRQATLLKFHDVK